MIHIHGLTKRFGERVVLDGIDLEIGVGERIVIIGPSGTGKSTLLRCLNFLDRPDAGRIVLGELTVDAVHASRRDILALRRRTAFVFQNYALFANRTARQNITEALTVVKGMPRAEPLAQPLDPDHRANARPRRASSRRCTKESASTITQYMQATTRKASR